VVEICVLNGKAVGGRHERGRAPALLFIHGSAGTHRSFEPLLEVLDGYERYAIDLPGRADSVGPALEDVSSMASFVTELVASELDGAYVVLGHSLGGAVALEHAITTASKELAGMVLLATGARLRVQPIILRLHEEAAKLGGPLPPLPPGLFEDATEPGLIAAAQSQRQGVPARTAMSDWRAANAFDRMTDLGRIEVPALIVAGTEDTLTPPKYSEYMAANIGKSELHMLRGAGHMLILERAEELAVLIGRFLSRL
jgi:pimeloyl-ACP methyl ester carboxylesterase